MALDPGTIQQMLAQRLQQPQQQGGVTPQMSPANTAAQLAQKALLVKALQSQQATQAANAGMPAMNQQMQQDPTMQALQQSPAPLQQQFPVLDPSVAGGQ